MYMYDHMTALIKLCLVAVKDITKYKNNSTFALLVSIISIFCSKLGASSLSSDNTSVSSSEI